jgi:hypothetical protein
MVTVVDSLDKDFQWDEKTEGESTTAPEERRATRATAVMDGVSNIVKDTELVGDEMSDTIG